MRRMGADHALADDLAQDAFLAGFERIAEYRGEGAFPAWVKRIGARLYVRRWRRRRKGELAEEIAETATVARLEDPDRRMDLDEALKRLPDPERVCVCLCYGAGFSHTEAAELLNAPLGTVKSHVRRGLDRLRERFGQTGEAGRRGDE